MPSDTALVLIIAAVAVGYLLAVFLKKGRSPGDCGCGGCGGGCSGRRKPKAVDGNDCDKTSDESEPNRP